MRVTDYLLVFESTGSCQSCLKPVCEIQRW